MTKSALLPFLLVAAAITFGASIGSSATSSSNQTAASSAKPTPTARATSTPTPTPTPTFTPTPTPTQVASQTPTPAATSTSSATATSTPGPVTASAIYVTDESVVTISKFPAGISGNAKPSWTIGGAGTQMVIPLGIFVDSFSDVFEANSFTNGIFGNSVNEFGPQQRGDLKPIASIAGSNTTISFPIAVALDAAGNIYVANGSISNSISVFPPFSTGNILPSATIAGTSTGLASPGGIVVDKKGNIYVSNSNADSIAIFAPIAAGSTGDIAPATTISGAATGLAGPAGLALDSVGNIYVANASNDSVTEYQVESKDDAAPIATISGSGTGLNKPGAVAVDNSGNIYVANFGGGNVLEFASGSNGDVAPLVTIAGDETGLVEPSGIAIASQFPIGTPSVPATPTPTPTPHSYVALSKTSIDFPATVAGGKRQTESFTITNAGNTIKGNVVSSLPKDFTVKGRGRFTLGHAKTKTIEVEFTPSSPGTFAGNVDVTTVSPRGSATVSVTATAKSGTLTVSPGALNFGDVPVGSEQTLAFAIKNTGVGLLTGSISPFKLGGGFSVPSGLGNFKLSAGRSFQVDVQFAPKTGGRSSGSVIIKSDDPAHLTAAVIFGGTGT